MLKKKQAVDKKTVSSRQLKTDKIWDVPTSRSEYQARYDCDESWEREREMREN